MATEVPAPSEAKSDAADAENGAAAETEITAIDAVFE